MYSVSENDHYVFVENGNGDDIVVEDLAQSDAAYASEIGEESDGRYEVRQKGLTLGRGSSAEDIVSILSGKTGLESDEIELDL